MKNTLILSIAILLVSCRPVKEIVQVDKIIVKDSIVERLIPINVDVPVYLPGDTVYSVSEKIVVRDTSQQLMTDTVFAYGNLAWSMAFIAQNKLHNELYEKDTTLQARYDSLVAVFDSFKTSISTSSRTETIEVKRNSNFAKFCIKWFFITIALIALTIVTKFYNPLRR